MGYTIFITEKPSVAREYVKVLQLKGNGKKTVGYVEGHSPVLNKDVRITWAVGHLIAISQPGKQNPEWEHKNWSDNKKNLPMIPEVWKYEAQAATYDQFKAVKAVYTMKDTDEIYYAGDSGREGIYIQALIRNQIFKTKPKFPEKVVWIDSFTEEAILKGIREAKPYSEYENMIASGYARAKSDWLIGMNLTQAFSITSGYMAVGRVMTPTLALIVKRQQEIDDFKEEDFYGVNALMSGTSEDKETAVKWKSDDSSEYNNSPLLFNEGGFKNTAKDECEKFIGKLNTDGHLTVKDIKATDKTEYAPLLFNLADLQAHCSKTYHITPNDTLKIAQELYEEKKTTYPRTDARVLSSAVAAEIKQKTGKTVPGKYVNDAKITDHYAIIPTNYNADPAKCNGDSLKDKVYRDIVARFYAVFMPPYKYTSYQAVYEALGREHFFQSLKKVEQLGWRELYNEKIQNTVIPEKGQVVSANFVRNDMKTTPPPFYTTGSIILTMEKAGKFIEDEELREQIKTCGIGTSATRAGIIEKLVKNKMIEIDKKQKITATKLGMSIIPIVEKYDAQLTSPEKTADMEQQLSDIASGNMTSETYEEGLNAYLKETVNNILNNNTERVSKMGTEDNNDSFGKCPKCGSDVVKGKFGVYCTGKCGAGLSKVFGKELTDAQIKKLLSGKEIKIKGSNGRETIVQPELVENEYNGKTYFNWKTGAASNAAADAEPLGKCPKCGGEIKMGQYGYYCTSKCGMNVSKVYGIELSAENIKALLKGETISVKGKKGQMAVKPEVVENEYNGKTYFNWATD